MGSVGREQRNANENGPNPSGSGPANHNPEITTILIGAVILFVLTVVLWTNRQSELQSVIDGLGSVEMAVIVTLVFVSVAIFVYFVAQKTLWDLLQLLIVPLALAGVGLWFTVQQDARQQGFEQERAQDTVLQAYLDQMSVLLIDKDLRDSQQGSEVRTLAQTRTLTVLDQLDPEHKTQLVRFLIEDRLVQGDIKMVQRKVVGTGNPVISLDRADLSGVDMSNTEPDLADLQKMPKSGFSYAGYHTDLAGAQLNYANLSGADLSGASVYHASLNGTNLSCANLSNTTFEGSNLSFANLRHAKGMAEREHYLGKQSWPLVGATMPNGQQYEVWLEDKKDLSVDSEECNRS